MSFRAALHIVLISAAFIYTTSPGLILAQTKTLVINEVMASNGHSHWDEDGDYEDWIELYNNTPTTIDLEGYGLSDDCEYPFKWTFPNVSIEAGDFMFIWASGKDRRNSAAPLHTNYSISAAGEEILLSDVDGNILDKLGPTEIPRDLSYGRYPDGGSDWYYFKSGTPHAPNSDPSYKGLLPQPEFSHTPGFYNTDLELSITHPDSNVQIFFTTDGTDPLITGAPYAEPLQLTDRSQQPNYFSVIPTNFISSQNPRGWNPPKGLVNKANTIRAIAVSEEYRPAENTGFYCILPKANDTYQLPVFSIITDSLNLFGHETGIYVPGANYESPDGGTGNFRMRGREWERPAWLSFFDKNGTEVVHQEVGLRIHGGFTRRFPQKSLRIYARRDYRKNTLDYSFFNDENYNSFKRLILRNSGNDWNRSMLRDGTIQKIWKHVGMEGQNFSPSIVFINGEYWGIHHIRERQDKHYLNRKFGLHEDEIDILTSNWRVKEGDSLHFQSLIDFVLEKNIAKSENYEEVKRRMDVDNFLDYYALQIYCGNTDWPHNNIDFWRKKISYDPEAPPGMDGRWRWMVYDLDRCLGYTSVHTNMIDWVTSPIGNYHGAWSTLMIRTLLENSHFKTNFINRIADHLNSTFLTSRVQAYIADNKSLIEGSMEEHIHRWQRPVSLSGWNSLVNMLNHFANRRPEILREHLLSHFNIAEEINLTLDISHSDAGIIQLNSLKINAELPGTDEIPYPWSGIYFSNVEVKLTPHPFDGYRFSHWDINGMHYYDKDLSIAFNEDAEVTAYFEIDEDYDFNTDPFTYDNCAYAFHYWNSDSKVGTYPENMVFVYMKEDDPGPDAIIDSPTHGVYHLDNRTRISGLNEDGFSFINTGNRDGNSGYPGRKLGGAILSLNTLDSPPLYLRWEGGTVTPNSRVYHLRLQYRLNQQSEFVDFTDEEGKPIEYIRSEEAGHSLVFGPLPLPDEAYGLPNFQLFWRYYHTGERLEEESGARDELRIGHILIGSDSTALAQNEPEIFTPEVVFEKTAACFDEDALGMLNIDASHTLKPSKFMLKEDTFEVSGKLEIPLEAGEYEYELIDRLGCKTSGIIEIPFSPEIIIHAESVAPTCAGDLDGRITATIEGGTEPFQYEWSTGKRSENPKTIALWDFNGSVPNDSPPPAIGKAEAILIGGTTNPIWGTDGNGSSDTSSTNDAWQTTNYPAQGQSPLSAGVQFNISTEGYRDLAFVFDQRLSNTTANNWVLQYTLNHAATEVVWHTAKEFRVEPQYTGTGDTWFNGRSFDFSEVELLNDNPYAAFRIVSDFDPHTDRYESARLDRDYAGGTSRWDMVRLTGGRINRALSINNLSNGNYSLTVEDKVGCTQVKNIFLPEPDELPIPNIIGEIEAENHSKEIYVAEISGGEASTYELKWEVEGGEITQFISNDSVVVYWNTVQGDHPHIKLTLKDSIGCTSENILEMYVLPTDIEKNASDRGEVLIYPNPTYGLVYVELKGVNTPISDIKIDLYNSLGQQIRDPEIHPSDANGWLVLKINQPGIHYLVLRNLNGDILSSEKVLVF